jgi:hypothetical protein
MKQTLVYAEAIDVARDAIGVRARDVYQSIDCIGRQVMIHERGKSAVMRVNGFYKAGKEIRAPKGRRPRRVRIKLCDGTIMRRCAVVSRSISCAVDGVVCAEYVFRFRPKTA